MATIVVIDDDQAFAQFLEESLTAEGYTVFKGYDGQMAMRFAKTEHPDLMILDVNMPLGNGLETLKALRADPATYDIPVIFLTGASSSLVYPTVEKTSRVTYLKKPVELDELYSMVRHFLASYLRLADTR